MCNTSPKRSVPWKIIFYVDFIVGGGGVEGGGRYVSVNVMFYFEAKYSAKADVTVSRSSAAC